MATVLIVPTASARGRRQASPDTITETKSIPAQVEYRFSRTVGAGRLVKAQEGKPGKVVRTFEVKRKNGKIVAKECVSEIRVDPEPTIYNMGRAGWQRSSRSGFVRGKVLSMHATAYDPSPGQNGGSSRVKLGYYAGYGQVAVDPRVIPLGTMVYVEGYGFAIASDTGSAIKGNRIDLCMRTNAECNRFGRRTVRVHVLRGR